MEQNSSGGLLDEIANLLDKKLDEKLKPVNRKLEVIDNSMTVSGLADTANVINVNIAGTTET